MLLREGRGAVLVLFLVARKKYPNNCNLSGDKVYFGLQFKVATLQSEERDGYMLVFSCFSLLFSPSRGSSGIHKGAWQWGRWNLPTSVNMIKVIPHRHSQKPFSQVTSDCVKLTVVSSFQTEIIDTKPGSG